MSDPKAKTRLVGGFLRISGARTRNRTKDTGIFNPLKKTKRSIRTDSLLLVYLKKNVAVGCYKP
ncbi:hypothetical protein EFJ58_03135 [Escherichia coli]|nr:hypothetical protein [Escherichia coli]EFB5242270.1 hypothetical protein [Escherichia coli]EFE3301412.1 hypothetical protein [Escherichia coli]MCH7128986.1 hypothetical protein [Escherichia coli]